MIGEQVALLRLRAEGEAVADAGREIQVIRRPGSTVIRAGKLEATLEREPHLLSQGADHVRIEVNETLHHNN